MNVTFYDKSGGLYVHAGAQAAETVFGASNVTRIAHTATNRVEMLRTATLAVGHVTEADFEALIAPPSATVKIVIRVSSQGRGGMAGYRPPYRLSEGGPWIFHFVEPAEKVSNEYWTSVFTALNRWERNAQTLSSDLVDLFYPNSEALIALRLLCEAWMICDGEEQKMTDRGITIRGPANLRQWLAPFGENATADSIAKQMGHSEKQAADLFGAITIGANKEAIRAAIEIFVGTTK